MSGIYAPTSKRTLPNGAERAVHPLCLQTGASVMRAHPGTPERSGPGCLGRGAPAETSTRTRRRDMADQKNTSNQGDGATNDPNRDPKKPAQGDGPAKSGFGGSSGSSSTSSGGYSGSSRSSDSSRSDSSSGSSSTGSKNAPNTSSSGGMSGSSGSGQSSRTGSPSSTPDKLRDDRSGGSGSSNR